jgi:Uma2 family endonuclease
MPEAKDEEVMNGEIRIMPMAKASQAINLNNLYGELRALVDRSRFRALTGGLGVVIRVAPLTCSNPDLAVFDRSSAVVVDGCFRSAPELAAGALSPRNTPKDMRLKIEEYSTAGFPELWPLSQENRSVEVLLPEGGRLQRKGLLTEGWLTPSRFPQVAINIASIWPERRA